MKTSTTFSILIWINTSRLKNNEAEIFARVTVNLRRTNISLKRKIDVESWNRSKGRVKGNCKEARTLNLYLDQEQARLFECYQELRAEQQLVTAQAVKARFLGLDTIHHSLLELIEYHNTTMVNKLHYDTMRHYKTSQHYLRLFMEQKMKTSDVYLKDLNYAFVINFENFLRAHVPADYRNKIGNNTVMKHIQRLRKMVTMAFKMEWIVRDPFVKFQSSFEKSEREFLSEEELQSIEAFTSSFERLSLVKDLFIFSCYTGIAYVDVMTLTKDNILRGIDGNLWIITKRQKTGTSVKIPILEQTQYLIDKYHDSVRANITGTLFPVMSNQKVNSYLKEIAEVCGIKKNLTFHVARHTFATTVTLTNGVPIETVSKLLGHTKLATTQIYAKVIERKVSDDMQALRFVLDKNKKENELKNGESIG
ncbi:MAG: integrase [Lutibacter sp. BRH_c52]|nr:MAG: integrase [Lutibacter sp. BRH_c52]HCE55806.1 integrase [Lutibacter sp.]